MLDDENELDESELEPPRPYTDEERAEIEELMSGMAADLEDINGK